MKTDGIFLANLTSETAGGGVKLPFREAGSQEIWWGGPPKKSQFGLKSLLVPARLGLRGRWRGAPWNWVVFNTLRGLILPLSV